MHPDREDSCNNMWCIRRTLESPVREYVGGMLLFGFLLPHQQSGQVFKGSAEVVPIYATVSLPDGRLVTDLAAGDFEVFDNGVRQSITYFRSGVAPVSVIILLDGSPSVFSLYGSSNAAVAEFAKDLLPEDRASIGVFSQVVTMGQTFTSDPHELMKVLALPEPWPAGTAIWDAIKAAQLALSNQGGRRVILVLSDGMDNASTANPDDIRIQLQRDGVLVYFCALRGRFGTDSSDIGALANTTGGRTVSIGSSEQVAVAMRQIADELHNQYILSFVPAKLDGRLHRVDVRVKRHDVVVRARRWYYAAQSNPQ